MLVGPFCGVETSLEEGDKARGVGVVPGNVGIEQGSEIFRNWYLIWIGGEEARVGTVSVAATILDAVKKRE